MEPRTIIVDAHSMRRHERLSALKECLAAGILLRTAWHDLRLDGVTGLALANLLVGLAVLGIGAMEMQRGRKFGSWIRWFDIAAGGLMALEGATLAAEGHHSPSLIYGYYGLGATYVLLGAFHTQVGRRRYIRIDDDGIQVRLTPLRRFRLPWPDIVRVVGHADSIEVFDKAGKRHEITRRHVPTLDEMREVVLDRASGRGIATN